MSDNALGRIQAATGADAHEVAFLADLADPRAGALADAVERALARESAALTDAIDAALARLPGALAPAVRAVVRWWRA